MRHLIGTLFSVVFLIVAANTCAATSVVLSLSDNSFSVFGTLKSFDGEFYEIETSQYGPLTFAAQTTTCSGLYCPNTEIHIPTIHVATSTALGKQLLPALIRNFAIQNGFRLRLQPSTNVSIEVVAPNHSVVARFKVTFSNAEESYAALSQGRADIILTRRGPTETERKSSPQAQPPYHTQVVGWDSLKFYTAYNGDISALKMRELADAADQLSSSTMNIRGNMDHLIALRQKLGYKDDITDTIAVENSPIVYVSANTQLPLQPIILDKTCVRDDSKPVLSQSNNTFQVPIYLMTNSANKSSVLHDFWVSTISKSGQDMVFDVGFNSRTSMIASSLQDTNFLRGAILNATDETTLKRLKRALRRLDGYERFPITFNFNEGQQTLDTESKSHLAFVASLLQTAPYKGRTIFFAGFSDGNGDADQNADISKKRAQVVRDSIRNIMGNKAPLQSHMPIHGFGEVLPLACNDTKWGQNQNRRVEIWIR